MNFTLPLDGVLDLHSFRPSELQDLVTEWLIATRERGLHEVRIIHGKGTGVQRERVMTLLDRQPLVMRHLNDPSGNWGARVAWLHPRTSDAARVQAVLEGCPRLIDALKVAAEHGPPGAWIGAGAVRNALWHRLHGQDGEPDFADIDVIYSDPDGPDEATVLARLRAARPTLAWEVCDQARLPSPAASVAEALARWPETATCVAARWADGVQLLAPLGLDDLLAMVIRHNPACPEAAFRGRLASKRWRQRFPWVTVMR